MSGLLSRFLPLLSPFSAQYKSADTCGTILISTDASNNTYIVFGAFTPRNILGLGSYTYSDFSMQCDPNFSRENGTVISGFIQSRGMIYGYNTRELLSASDGLYIKKNNIIVSKIFSCKDPNGATHYYNIYKYIDVNNQFISKKNDLIRKLPYSSLPSDYIYIQLDSFMRKAFSEGVYLLEDKPNNITYKITNRLKTIFNDTQFRSVLNNILGTATVEIPISTPKEEEEEEELRVVEELDTPLSPESDV